MKVNQAKAIQSNAAMCNVCWVVSTSVAELSRGSIADLRLEMKFECSSCCDANQARDLHQHESVQTVCYVSALLVITADYDVEEQIGHLVGKNSGGYVESIVKVASSR